MLNGSTSSFVVYILANQKIRMNETNQTNQSNYPVFTLHQATPACSTDDAVPATQQLIPFFNRWAKAQEITAEDQVISVIHHTRSCDIKEVTPHRINLIWNQVFLAVDRVSRRGEVKLVPKGRDMYTFTFSPRDGRPTQHSLPSHHKEVIVCLLSLIENQ
jgi:hypothetical protein